MCRLRHARVEQRRDGRREAVAAEAQLHDAQLLGPRREPPERRGEVVLAQLVANGQDQLAHPRVGRREELERLAVELAPQLLCATRASAALTQLSHQQAAPLGTAGQRRIAPAGARRAGC